VISPERFGILKVTTSKASEKMSVHVIIGLSMVAVGLVCAVFVVVLILRERRKDRNIID
jgi:hypothetical protein